MDKYSVLISVYAKEKSEYLGKAIESMLCQTLPPDEVVLVCDGPLTPELDSVIEKYWSQHPNIFKVIRLEKNCGLGIALAKGLHVCRNELIARMDSDDIAVADRMERQIDVMERNPNVSAVGGQIVEFEGDITNKIAYRCVPKSEREIRKVLPFRNPMNHVTVCFRKADILSVGNYQDLRGFEDYFLWGRLISAGKHLINLDTILCYVRIDDAMYMRRGGFQYFRNTVKLQKHLLNLEIISKAQFCRNVVIRFFATMGIPNRLRGVLFRKVMRSSVERINKGNENDDFG